MAHAEYFNAQQKLQNIFANCQDWNNEQFRHALNGLLDSTVQMVRAKTSTVAARHSISDSSDSSYSDSDSDSDTPQPAAARAALPLRPRTLPVPPPQVVTQRAVQPLRPRTLPGPPPPRVAIVMPNQTG